jgi:hypothetical protein
LPVFWTIQPDSPAVMTEAPLLDPSGHGIMGDGETTEVGVQRFYGWASNDMGMRKPVEWIYEDGMPPVLNVLPTSVQNDEGTIFRVHGSLLTGWSTDAQGLMKPVIWMPDPDPVEEWQLLELPTLGGPGRGNGIIEWPPDYTHVVGEIMDGGGNTIAAVWSENEFGDMILHTPPMLPGYANSAALNCNVMDNGNLNIVGRSYNTEHDAQATAWTYAPGNGSWTVANLNVAASALLTLSVTTAANVDILDIVFFGAGFLSGASKAVIEPHAYATGSLTVTATQDPEEDLPGLVSTEVDAFPNPFNPQIQISFGLPESGHAKLTIYDLRGRRIVTLQDSWLERGRHDLVWNGLSDKGRAVGSGVYLLRLESAGGVMTKKVTLAK